MAVFITFRRDLIYLLLELVFGQSFQPAGPVLVHAGGDLVNNSLQVLAASSRA
ncbi:MAG: hypothetical protein R3C56_18725 [Pirellulaceae bacterium]